MKVYMFRYNNTILRVIPNVYRVETDGVKFYLYDKEGNELRTISIYKKLVFV